MKTTLLSLIALAFTLLVLVAVWPALEAVRLILQALGGAG